MNDASAFWDGQYASEAFKYGTAPNAFLAAQIARLQPGMTALAVADGEGRNGVWLAEQGLAVTTTDIAPRAVEKALALARTLGRDDLLIALVSGGGSSLMSLPAPGIAADEKIGLLRALLKCGANIAELNCVRKHMSGVKGGRLARAAGELRKA